MDKVQSANILEGGGLRDFLTKEESKKKPFGITIILLLPPLQQLC
jgi:hypothetical protein